VLVNFGGGGGEPGRREHFILAKIPTTILKKCSYSKEKVKVKKNVGG